MKYAVVTGATKGIGKSIAEKLLSEGWYVFVNYAHDRDAAEQFACECRQQEWFNFEIFQADLSEYEQVKSLIAYVIKRTEHIDALILNAGATDRTPFGSITWENWEQVIHTNLSCPFYLTQGLYENITENEGRIIFIGSICGIYPHALSPAYGVTKAAVHQMAKELVKFFAPRGITVNAIVPGFTDTPWQSGKTTEIRKRIEERIAIRRFAEPQEVAHLCWEIICNPAINGANLQIDGGYCLMV